MRAAHERARAALTAYTQRPPGTAPCWPPPRPPMSNWPPRVCRPSSPRPARAAGSARYRCAARTSSITSRSWRATGTPPPTSVPSRASRRAQGLWAHWRCHRCDHRWVAPVLGAPAARRAARTVPPVGRRRPPPSLRCIPSWWPSWTPNADGSADPTLRAASRRRVVWRCPAQADHAPYRMSLGARARVLVGCPVCRGQRPSRGEQRADSAA